MKINMKRPEMIVLLAIIAIAAIFLLPKVGIFSTYSTTRTCDNWIANEQAKGFITESSTPFCWLKDGSQERRVTVLENTVTGCQITYTLGCSDADITNDTIVINDSYEPVNDVIAYATLSTTATDKRVRAEVSWTGGVPPYILEFEDFGIYEEGITTNSWIGYYTYPSFGPQEANFCVYDSDLNTANSCITREIILIDEADDSCTPNQQTCLSSTTYKKCLSGGVWSGILNCAPDQTCTNGYCSVVYTGGDTGTNTTGTNTDTNSSVSDNFFDDFNLQGIPDGVWILLALAIVLILVKK
jgi:hypothetical protein